MVTNQRIHVDIPVEITLSSGDKVHARFVTLSSTGAEIEYGAAADKGTVLQLRYVLSQQKQHVEFQVRVRVVHSYLHHNLFHIGVQFLDLKDEQRKILDGFLSYLRSVRHRE